jgi:hypothetical protein
VVFLRSLFLYSREALSLSIRKLIPIMGRRTQLRQINQATITPQRPTPLLKPAKPNHALHRPLANPQREEVKHSSTKTQHPPSSHPPDKRPQSSPQDTPPSQQPHTASTAPWKCQSPLRCPSPARGAQIPPRRTAPPSRRACPRTWRCPSARRCRRRLRGRRRTRRRGRSAFCGEHVSLAGE